ncbi:MAG: alpha/beta hydrolase [Beijerinckiaceae bacterium]
MQERVSFKSDGLDLAGILHIPEDLKKGEKRPAFMVLHGFGTNKDGTTPRQAAEILENMGYIVLRFDMRGCGESGGEHAYILCQDQVRDTQSAVTFLETVKQVDAKKIGVLGHSFGGAVAPYAAAVDKRIAACVSVAGWGDGVSKFREQHKSPAAWKRFLGKLEQGRRHRQKTGKSLMVPRFDIVPIPPAMRHLLVGNAIMEFPAETAMSMMDFRANDVVGLIAPRPYLILHPADDTVTPTSQALGLFANAKMPTDMHLVTGVDHFMFHEDDGVVRKILEAWLAKNIPVKGKK